MKLPMTMSAAHYTQADAFHSEKHNVFAHAWVPIAVKEQLTQPGQYVTASPGGWPMLAVCGADGVARAFRNLCRHRELQLAEHDAGTCANFQCRHHGWVYDLAGGFFDAPPAVAPGADGAAQALTALGLQSWGAVVLVNWQADAAPLAHPAQWSAGKVYVGVRMIDIACNWKTLLETLLPADDVGWQWPLLVLHTQGALTLVDRIVPRMFLRTRVIRHAYLNVDMGADADLDGQRSAAQAALAALNGLKGEAEQLQAARAQGVPADLTHARVAELHARLNAADARSASAVG